MKDESPNIQESEPAPVAKPKKTRAKKAVEKPVVVTLPATIDAERRGQLVKLLAVFRLKENESVGKRLHRALIHRSYRTEAGISEDNERLEFLGDSVIGLACTEYLLKLNPDMDEGVLSKIRAAAVSRAVLGDIAKSIGIGPLLLLGTGEERSGGRERASILGSALEAVCGAIYLSYKWEEIREPLCVEIIDPALTMIRQDHVVDFKSRLQEWSQRDHQVVPTYRVIGEGGPDHSKVFEVEVLLGERILAKGAGKRKKQAENDAARQAMEKLVEEKEAD